jgi:hypothetical protein
MAKLDADAIDASPALPVERLQSQIDDKATVVIGAADGWRHGTPGVDLTDDSVHLEDLDLAKSSIERVGVGRHNLSAGEKLLAGRIERLLETESL